EGGTYFVNEAMLADARGNRRGTHASNLGCALAQALADHATRAAAEARLPADGDNGAASEPGKAPFQPAGPPRVPAFIVDPVSVDEFEDLARISGLRGVERISLSHALSIHALVQEVCRGERRPLEGSRFVVAHLGGGISVCPVSSGRIIDANNANSGGPFSPTRAGGLPTQELIDLCFSGDHTVSDLREMTVKRGGLVSYLGTDDARTVEERIEAGDHEAMMVFEAMAYQIAKEIGAMATVLEGSVDKVLLTGGLASSGLLVKWVRDRVSFIGPVEVWPEVGEMRALALGALGVLRGELQAKEY
ncbi:MAG: butyrate kinase, partial [Gemmatimonadetes bacterium]|nr:butyrate kinase [Gemmatimonadota bacterium]